MICVKIKYEIINSLCGICDICPFDVDVVCGRYVVDGTSVLGVIGLIDHTVELKPLTTDINAINEFYKKVAPLGAYKKGEIQNDN